MSKYHFDLIDKLSEIFSDAAEEVKQSAPVEEAENLFGRRGYCREPVPTLIDLDGFNPESDAVALYSAMKGAGTDENVIISVICQRSYRQLKKIEHVYQQMFGQELLADIKSDLSGDFEKLALTLFRSNVEQDAVALREAVAGLGTDEKAIIDILCTRDNSEINLIKTVYRQMYGVDLVSDLRGDTKGNFRMIVTSLCAGERDEKGGYLGKEEAKLVALMLFAKGETQFGTNEVVFNRVLCRRGFHQLKEIFAAYEEFHKQGMIDTIKREFSGVAESAYKAIATSVLEGRETYFADKIYSACKGLGTDEDRLIRLIVARSRIDLVTVADTFKDKYGKPLEEYLEKELSGNFKHAILTLVKGNK